MGDNNFDTGGGTSGTSGTTSTSSESSSSSLPSTLREFASNPRGFILGIVATWLVGGILTAGRTVVDSVLLAFDAIVFALESATGGVIGALDSVAAPVLEAAAGVPDFYMGLVEPFGPLAPLVAGVGVAVTLVLTYRAAKTILLGIPFVGGFLEFLGVDI